MTETSNEKLLKVAFLSVFPPFRGGISVFSERVVTSLEPRCNVITVNFSQLYPGFLFPGTDQFMEEDSNSFEPRIMHAYKPWRWGKVEKFLNRVQPDVVIYSYWHPFFAPMLISIMKRISRLSSQPKVIGLIHNALPHDGFPFKKEWFRRLMKFTNLAVTLSKETTERVRELCPQSTVWELFHPLPDMRIQSTKQRFVAGNEFKATDTVFLYAGLVRKYKGVDLFIETMADLLKSQPSVYAVIAGEFYEDESEYRKMIPNTLADRILIVNRFLTDEELNQAIYHSDFVVLPYKSGTQSGILAQSIALGTPVICSDLPGLSMYLSEGKTGLTFPVGDKDAFRNLILDLIEDEHSFRSREEDFEEARDRWSWKRFGEQLYDSFIV